MLGCECLNCLNEGKKIKKFFLLLIYNKKIINEKINFLNFENFKKSFWNYFYLWDIGLIREW